MGRLKTALWIILGFLLLAGAGTFVVMRYSWVFSKRVQGEILGIERITTPDAILGKVSDEQLHSYAIMIKSKDGHLYTASSDDRKWQVVKKGLCVQTLLFVYPPWDLKNAGTYFNARMEDVYQCDGSSTPIEAPPATDAPSSGK